MRSATVALLGWLPLIDFPRSRAYARRVTSGTSATGTAEAGETGALAGVRKLARIVGRGAVSFVAVALVTSVIVFAAFTISYTLGGVAFEAAYSTDFLPLEIATVVVLAGATAAGIWISFTGGRIETWLEEGGRILALAFPLCVVAFAVATFAGATALLFKHGALELRGSKLDEETIFGSAADFYLWHLLDAVPFVDIPGTLRWEARFTYSDDDSVTGALLLAFKVMVLLPLISAVRLVASGGPYRNVVAGALRRAYPSAKVIRSRRRLWTDSWAVLDDHGRTVLLGDDRILLDAMREVHTVAQPEGRMARIARVDDAGELTGHLLVTGSVTAAARREVEELLPKAPVPAAFVVWRPDEPVTALADQVAALREEIARRRATS
jgi:hypothetical protein